jgi:hypothetical protein
VNNQTCPQSEDGYHQLNLCWAEVVMDPPSELREVLCIKVQCAFCNTTRLVEIDDDLVDW